MMNDDPIFESRAIENGAMGYIGKCEDPTRIVAAIRTVAMGRTFLPPEVARKLAFFKFNYRNGVVNGFDTREREILHTIVIELRGIWLEAGDTSELG
jgi:two-component system invasion response regulator UvrY